MAFSVQLDIFRGPLDLLLYLVRKHEVEITEIPICSVTDQYLEYLEILEQMDVDAVGDFLDLASTLIEIKSRMVLPRGGEEEGDFEDPRQDLVERLLEYKKFRDAASLLEDQSRCWQQHFSRQTNDLPPRQRNLAEEPIHEVELWDLVSAFSRILRENQAQRPSNIVYDDTPIHVYMEMILDSINAKGRVAFSQLFRPGMHKSSMIGVFLATLELVRHYNVVFQQNSLFGEIWLIRGDGEQESIDASSVDDYAHGNDKSTRSG
jgi:segregation and condensation protein A